jgi:hypothetical protein
MRFYLADNTEYHNFTPQNFSFKLFIKKKRIMKISLVRLSTKDLATLAQRVINSSKNNALKVADSHPLLLKLETEYGKYFNLYAKTPFSGKGELVAAADRRRDEPFMGIKAMAKTVAGINGMPNQQAAVEVLEVLKTYGLELHNLSYSSQTAQMLQLIEALDTEKMQENLSALNLSSTYSELKAAQADFEAIYAEQAEANAELRSLPSASAARKDLEKALRNYLDLLSLMSEEPEWSGVYADINEMVKAAINS